MLEINRGYTMDYLIHGTFSLIVAGISATFSSFLVICFLILAFCFYIIQTGISVDFENRKIRKYRSLLGKQFGPWTSIDPDDIIKLGLTDESQRMNSRGASTNVRAKTYDLIIVKNKEQEIIIYEFSKYTDAITLAQRLSDTFDLPLNNECRR